MTEKTDALIPVAQKQVLFYEDEITAVRTKDGQVYVPIRPLCNLLGIAWAAQRTRINRDPVLAELITVVIVTIPTAGATPTQSREMLCLPLEVLNGWLFGVNASRVKESVRDKLIRYQKECYKVLHEAFQDGRLTADPDLEALLQEDSPEAQAYKMIQGMLRLAHNQLLMKARLQDHEQRLEAIESQLGDPTRYVTPAQATSISQAVKAIALILSKQTRRNEYGAVFGELYRRYNVPSYRELPAHKYQECLDWLSEWKAQLESDTF